ncbi:MAG: hypothetical protein AAB225_01435 [Acidobacteriota bacterium]
MKLTRRQAAAALVGAPALAAQAQPGAAKAETPAELLAAAKDRLRRNAETLARTQVPMSAEPAFSFKAL